MNAEGKGCDADLIGILNLPMAHFDSNKSNKANLGVGIHCECSVLEVNESAALHAVLALDSLDLMDVQQASTGRASLALTRAVPSMLLDTGLQVFRSLKDLFWVSCKRVEGHP